MLQKIFGVFCPQKKCAGGSAGSVLVVEDNDVDQRVIVSILTRAGYTVVTAHNGEEGLAQARAVLPDIIILDCMMPVMNGVDMCRNAKREDALKDIPILFLTANDTPHNIVECFLGDAEGYIEKPVAAKILLSQVRAILAERSASKPC